LDTVTYQSIHFVLPESAQYAFTPTVPSVCVAVRVSKQAQGVVCRRVKLEANTQGVTEMNFFMQMK
jgi:hypothetical protein